MSTMNCRLLYVVGQLWAGGLERQLCYLLKAMDRRRYAPVVAVWNFREDDFYVDHLREMEVPVLSPPGGASGALKLSWLRSVVRRLNPEVVHSYSFYTNFAAWYAAIGTSVVPVGSVRSDFRWAIRQAGVCLGRLCSHWPRNQIFNSHTAAETARSSYGPLKPRRVFVVRNGIDLHRFGTTSLTNHGVTQLIGIGSLTPVKRWDRLLKAAWQLKRLGIQFMFRMVGDGPLRESLEGQVTELRIRDRVEFLGQRNDISALLSEAAFLVLTSESEGCPNVVMEAMASGRAVVATDAGDIPFLVDNGKTGFVVRRADDYALVSCLAALIGDHALCARMGEAGRETAQRGFGLQRLAGDTLAAYRAAGWYDTTIPLYETKRGLSKNSVAEWNSMGSTSE